MGSVMASVMQSVMGPIMGSVMEAVMGIMRSAICQSYNVIHMDGQDVGHVVICVKILKWHHKGKGIELQKQNKNLSNSWRWERI